MFEPELHPSLQARLNLLASDLVTRRVPVIGDAITLACDLLVAGDESSSTAEVASLTSQATFGESENVLRQMLADNGIDLSRIDRREGSAEAYLHGFGLCILTIEEFLGQFYGGLPEWSQQDPLTRTLVVLADQWESETNPDARLLVVEQMRQAIRDVRYRASPAKEPSTD